MIITYPDKAAIRGIFSSRLSPGKIRKLCKQSGIFILENDDNKLADAAALFYWGHDDLTSMSETMEDECNYQKMTRWEVSSTDTGINTLDVVRADLRSNMTLRIGDTIATIRYTNRYTNRVRNENEFEFQIHYVKKQLDRVKFLAESNRTFNIKVIRNVSGSVDFNVFYNDRNDLGIARCIIDRFDNPDIGNQARQIKITSLSELNKVNLFDRFFQTDMPNWSNIEILSIGVQKSDHDTDEDGPQEAEAIVLNGINSAILHGSGLRSNSFVQNCISHGYYFSEATIKYSHRREALEITIELAFKGKEKYAQIAICSSHESNEDGNYRVVLPADEQQIHLNEFYSQLADIFATLLTQQATQAQP